MHYVYSLTLDRTAQGPEPGGEARTDAGVQKTNPGQFTEVTRLHYVYSLTLDRTAQGLKPGEKREPTPGCKKTTPANSPR